jgi:hypothetical protein
MNRIAANGASALNHRYGELWADDFAADARLETVVEI